MLLSLTRDVRHSKKFLVGHCVQMALLKGEKERTPECASDSSCLTDALVT